MSIESPDIPTAEEILITINREKDINALLHKTEYGDIFVIHRVYPVLTQVVMRIKEDDKVVGVIRGVSANNPTNFVLTSFHNALLPSSNAKKLLFEGIDNSKTLYILPGLENLLEKSMGVFCKVLANTSRYGINEKFTSLVHEDKTTGIAIDLKKYE